MPRTARIAPGGWVFHVLNRANARARIFDKDADYAAFEQVLIGALERVSMRLVAYCVMPNHWHLVLWPRQDGDLGAFMQRLTTTHVRRWHLHRQSVGTGHLYQGTYKSFPVQTDEHFLTVCRYVERNALRAGLVRRAEDWPWCSLALPRKTDTARTKPTLCDGPIDRPRNWVSAVNQPETEDELEVLRRCVQRGRPYGGRIWQRRAAQRLGLQPTLRPRGRPRKRHSEKE